MEIILAVLGTALIVLALVDLFVTVLTTRGGGPVSSRLGEGSWRVLLRIHRRHNSQWTLAYAGPLIAILTVLGWVLMFWTGWLLIFSAGTVNLVQASTGVPADLWARLYFAGYTLFTLGLGDYRPEGAAWQVLTVLAVGNGFMVISLSASYLIPLVSAATTKRSTALYINGLGSSPSQILVTMWDGRGFSSLSQHLVTLTPAIIQAGQQHLAYPVLHYYQGMEPRAALPVQIARLGEVLDLLEHGIDPGVRLPEGITRPTGQAIADFIQVLQLSRLPLPPEAPSATGLASLRRAGIPVVAEEEYQEVIARRREERRKTLGVVQYGGWSWTEVGTEVQEAPDPRRSGAA